MSRVSELVNASPAFGLIEESGISPVTAAALVFWSHQDEFATRPRLPPSPT